jgi:hypothetical protein
VARTSSREEAELVCERLRDLGLSCLALGDEDLGLSFSENAVKRVRSMTFDDASLTIHQAGAAEETNVSWSEIVLILPGRLFETRLEIKERKTRKPENDLLDTSEFFKDETIIDFYVATSSSTWRVGAGGFDFSCLERDKALIANENIGKLQRLMVAKATNAQFDDSYPRVRNLLELAWSTQQETESSGWRRERPGLRQLLADIEAHGGAFQFVDDLQHARVSLDVALERYSSGEINCEVEITGPDFRVQQRQLFSQ